MNKFTRVIQTRSKTALQQNDENLADNVQKPITQQLKASKTQLATKRVPLTTRSTNVANPLNIKVVKSTVRFKDPRLPFPF
jgi:hypothetical protein